MAQKLPRSFYERDTVQLAQDLLGQKLIHIVRGRRLSGLIVETEAYLGAKDRASHGYGYRKTKRTVSLYQPAGFSYVYFIYGMHCCFNVVAQNKNEPHAVLIRALEPIDGIETMKRNRFSGRTPGKDIFLTNGPGKLCEALEIDLKDDQLSLTGREIFVEKGLSIPASEILATPRIGVDYAGEAAHWNLRFHIRNNPFVSKVRPTGLTCF
jgi:DNA-3-methyladenine glycosylase